MERRKCRVVWVAAVTILVSMILGWVWTALADSPAMINQEIALDMLQLCGDVSEQGLGQQPDAQIIGEDAGIVFFANERYGITTSGFESNAECKGMVAYSPSRNTVYLAFQGSENTMQWFADFDFSNNQGIHNGFRTQILDKFIYNAYLQKIIDIAKQNGSRFVLTGHSLGGALAQVYHYYLVNHLQIDNDLVTTYTFAAPIPFSSSLFDVGLSAKEYHCYNIVNEADIVPHVGVMNGYTKTVDPNWRDVILRLISNLKPFFENNKAGQIIYGANEIHEDMKRLETLLNTYTKDRSFVDATQKMLGGTKLEDTKLIQLFRDIKKSYNDEPDYNVSIYLNNNKEAFTRIINLYVWELYDLVMQGGSDGTRLGQDIVISRETALDEIYQDAPPAYVWEHMDKMHDRASYFTLLALAGESLYESVQQPDSVLEDITYDSSSTAGDVINRPKPSEPTQSDLSAFSVTPIEVVLVLDASGSMEEKRNPNNGKSVLSYAQDAAVAFAQTLFALNPESRISVVKYESEVETVCDLTRAQDSLALQSSIRAIRSGNQTNTGGGYARADEILKSQAEGGRKRVVLMLSDGMANVGPDAVTEGRRVAQSASVYTIGLVGGMSASEKDITHDILREGYQTQYFEVDFSSVSDISLYLAEAFLKIAMAGGQDVQETYYSLSLDGAMEVRVANAAGETLCSASGMLDTESSYGTLHFLGDEVDDKLLVLRGGDYDILLRGSEETMGSFALTSFNGVGMDMEYLLDSAVKIGPATCIALHVKDGKVTQENIPFNPINPSAIDPFTGAPTKGLSLAAQGYVLSNTAVYAANHKKAAVLEKLSKNVPVNVYALDPLTGWYLVGVTGKDGIPLRGWADGKTLDIKGYVPEMQFIGGEYTLAEGSPLYLAPSYSSRTADQVASGTVVELKHVERDRQGEEWAYVKTTLKNKDTWGYVPSRMLAGFQSIAPEGFRLGGDMPLKVYEKTYGENKYSEWMWASSPNEGDGGVVLSGRTASTKGDITKALGGRDAWVMRLDEQGDVTKVLTTGGSEVDSYHCVLPIEKGYLVSGITRSLDKNFQGIWDTGYYLGTVPQKLSWSNALIGMLDESFEPVWLKSFGTGSGSYGFDMVLKLSDGSIAGAGWSTAGRGSVLSDHGKQDFYAVKMTQSGQVMAMNCFGGAMDDVPDGGVATPDGGMLMIGRTASGHQGGGRYDGYALKLDASLAIEWEFSYGGNGEDTFDNVRMLADGTYLITGFTNSATGTGAGTAKGGMDFWAMRIDQFGRPIWNLRYGGSGDEELRGTTLLEDGSLILVGDTTSQDGQVRGYQRVGGKAAPTDGWAVCINEMGKVLWQYCQGGTGNDYFNSAAIDPADGCLVLAGVKDKKNDENAKAWAVKIQMPVNNPAD